MTDAPFEEPWHAQLLAVTVALNEAGHLPWPDWTAAFGAALARRSSPDGAADYYAAWLEALERLLAERGTASPEQLDALRAAWRDAYLGTPHGAPVRLARD